MKNITSLLALLAYILTNAQEFGNNDFRISDMGTDGTTSFVSFKPKVAYSISEDKYLVVWSADDNRGSVVDNEFEIYGQFIDGDGNEVGLNDFRISFLGTDGDTAFRAEDPDVAYNATDNEFFVVWRGETYVDGENEIFGQRIDASTGILLGSNLRISDMGTEGDTSTGAFLPKVEYSTVNNEYLVVWEGDDAINNKFEIYGQKISNLGVEIGSNDFKISAQLPANDANFDARYPNLSYNPTDNEFLIVWQGETATDGEIEAFGQLFNFDTNTLVGANFRISDIGPDGDTGFLVGQNFGVAYNETDGEYLVVWYGSDMVVGAYEVYGQRILATGAETGTNDFRISSITNVDANYDAWAPEVVWNKMNNEYFVTYRGDANILNEEEIHGQKLSNLGDLNGSVFLLSDMGPDNDANYDGDYPAIATNHQNGYLIAWQGDDNMSPNDGETEIYIQMYGDSTLGISKADFDNAVLFPNPTNKYLHVSFKKTNISSMSIYNLLGQKIDSFNYTNQVIDLGNLKKGMYLLKIKTSDERTQSFKIIKSE
ncbi:T9SS type A sorting domain-containing protein [Mariniflexile sp. HMF6888]|uniref:T9SS type A sorting domain-containing protein n=1 Tax=Mariniflexile sp. HMF6888 TaxID=3373086 RepID=UPI00379A3800